MTEYKQDLELHLSKRKMTKPKLIVFDLDHTLWPFFIAAHVANVDVELKKSVEGKVLDGRGVHINHFPEVPAVFEKIKAMGIPIGIASRTSYTRQATQLVNLFGWGKYISYVEIFPGTKLAHFKKLKEDSGFEYEDMLFYDDEYRNSVDLNPIGVTCILIDNNVGVTMTVFEDGLETFAKNNSKS